MSANYLFQGDEHFLRHKAVGDLKFQICLDKIALLIKMGIRLQLYTKTAFSTCGRNSAVECQLPKLDVVGSSPIARSNKIRGYGVFRAPFLLISEGQ